MRHFGSIFFFFTHKKGFCRFFVAYGSKRVMEIQKFTHNRTSSRPNDKKVASNVLKIDMKKNFKKTKIFLQKYYLTVYSLRLGHLIRLAVDLFSSAGNSSMSTSNNRRLRGLKPMYTIHNAKTFFKNKTRPIKSILKF